jgi:hypothetical protein
MTLVQTLYCQGRENRCWQSFVRATGKTMDLYTAARACGWQARPGGPDLCPACSKEEALERTVAGTCPACLDFVRVEFRDSLGHDNAGHRTGNTLASEGIVTWEGLLALPAPRMRKIRGLGDIGQDRIRWAQRHPKERYK